MAASIANAPDDLGPIDTLYRAFRSVHPVIEDNRPFSAPRHEVITNTPALQERELAKMAALADTLTAALKARGVAEQQAVLAARTGMAAFVYATVSWPARKANALEPEGARLGRRSQHKRAIVAGVPAGEQSLQNQPTLNLGVRKNPNLEVTPITPSLRPRSRHHTSPDDLRAAQA